MKELPCKKRVKGEHKELVTVSQKITQNHRMAWVGRDSKDHEPPTPLPGRATNLPLY